MVLCVSKRKGHFMKKWVNRIEATLVLGIGNEALRGRVRRGTILRKTGADGNFYYEIEVSTDSEKENILKSEKVDSFFGSDETNYHYDETKKEYIFFGLPDQPLSVKVSRDKINELLRDYSNYSGGMTINQIAGKYLLSRVTVQKILSILGKTHDSIPFSSETIDSEGEDALVSSLLKAKEQRVLVKAHQKSLREARKGFEDKALIKHLIAGIGDHLKTVKISKPKKVVEKSKKAYVGVLGLTDLHIGKRGVDGYNSKVASDRAIQTTSLAQNKAEEMWGAPDFWVITCGSDMIHVDNYRGTTEKGTPMDTDTDVTNMMAIAYSTMESIVLRLSMSAPVKIVAMTGNHDRLLSGMLGMMLSARFNSDDDIEVIDGSQGSAYIRYGKSLLGFNHGDSVKHNKLPNLMSGEKPKDWGECAGNWEWFTGHLHSLILKVNEYNGCRVWTMPALSGTDRWHKLMGYSLNRPQLAMFRVEPNNGVVGVELISPKKESK